MEYIIALILGTLQGLTEFLPVSSSGHLILAQHFLDYKEFGGLTFEVFLHFGSLCAVCIWYRKDIQSLILSLIYWQNKEYQTSRHICLWLLLATLLTGMIGFGFKLCFPELTNPLLVCILIGVTGFIIFYSDTLTKGSLQSSQLGAKKSLFIGFAQGIAILPGISRSGATIMCSLRMGLDREQAARFSFLLSIPAIIGANISEFKALTCLDQTQFASYIIGFLAAFVSGLLVIKLLIELIKKARLRYFSYYCWSVAVVSCYFIIF